MRNEKKLTEGNIVKGLVQLALPIMGTSFIQMTYNMMDMFWLGRVGSSSVAAVGTAGFFTWLAMAVVLIPKIGAEVGVAQSIGKEDLKAAKEYVNHTIQLDIFLALIYGVCLILFRKQLIGFFNLKDSKLINMAIDYLVIIAPGIIFSFLNPVLTGIFTGCGDSKTPFIINTIGLFINIILDPVLIFGFGPFPATGVKGAAVATVIAQFFVSLIFFYSLKGRPTLFSGFNLFQLPKKNYLKRILKLGFPVALQNGLFTIFAMFIARIIATWGPIPIAVQKVGSQIEAVSWMTAGGFSTALSTFVSQNYGAGKWKRIYKGYYSAIGIASIIGIATSCLLIFGARPIFSFFLPEKEAIKYGVDYLKILGLSQLFMCIEITTAGAFNGLGRTLPPAVIGILFNGLRIPGAKLLSNIPSLGLNGVWWSISISSIFKGVFLGLLFIIFLKINPEFKNKYLLKE